MDFLCVRFESTPMVLKCATPLPKLGEQEGRYWSMEGTRITAAR